jgi:epoxyqueuosine reductase
MMNQTLLNQLADNIKHWGKALGFQQVGICDTDLSIEEPRLETWLKKHYHGDMAWMEKYGLLRARAYQLQPGTLRVISVRMDYLPPNAAFAKTLSNPEMGYISRYALGRDYHKLLRQRLKQLGEQIQDFCREHCGEINFRPFVDSAPILERPLAEKAGIGWTGKHSLLINRNAGSWFFLGELFVDIPLPIDTPVEPQCGKCVACLTVCPTGAIVEPYIVDARRCISYLTIECDSVIPVEYRKLIGNRIYGCDDCQMICPWNRFAHLSQEADFLPRNSLDARKLIELYQWDESTFLKMTEGSAIRRISYYRWLRNITVALGNAPYRPEIIALLQARKGFSADLDQHIDWALEQQTSNQNDSKVSQKQLRLINAVRKGLPRDA